MQKMGTSEQRGFYYVSVKTAEGTGSADIMTDF